jgi:hypothetical protein
MNELETAFIAKIKTCNNCGEHRISLSFNMLTYEVKEAFKMFGEKAEYLYCKKCDVYASLSEFESSFG